jgi:hypothetical protein
MRRYPERLAERERKRLAHGSALRGLPPDSTNSQMQFLEGEAQEQALIDYERQVHPRPRTKSSQDLKRTMRTGTEIAEALLRVAANTDSSPNS